MSLFVKTTYSKVAVLFFTCLLAYLLQGCKKEERNDPVTVESEPQYLSGLLKRVEFQTDLDSVLHPSGYVNYNYDSLKRVIKLSHSSFFMNAAGGYITKYFYLYYNKTSLQRIDTVLVNDSLQTPGSPFLTLYRWQYHKLFYDAAGKKTGDSIYSGLGDPATSYISKQFYSYTYYLKNGYNYYCGPGASSNRAVYNSSGIFSFIDNRGDTPGEPDTTTILKVDSVYNEDSPLFFKNLHNPLFQIFGYEDLIFVFSWGFSHLPFEPHFLCEKLPKRVSTTYTSPLDFKLYRAMYFFTYEKNAMGKIYKVFITRKSYKPDGSSAGPDGKRIIKLLYYE